MASRTPIPTIWRYKYPIIIIIIIISQYCDVDLLTEFDNIKSWAERNKMTVNLSKTKEIIFRRPSPLQYHFVPSISAY